MKLILFDIDGTLIKSKAGSLHEMAFNFAIKEIFGVEVDINEIHPQGKIDSQILIETLGINGIDKETAISKLPDLYNLMINYFDENITDLHETVLPRVTECLDKLQKMDCVVGLLTGNLEGIAWAKMSKVGLRDYFSMGSFGNEALRRADLVSIALEKTKELDTTLENTYLVGDTPLDIECGKEAGCKMIAVASGMFSIEELEKNDPDFFTNDIVDVVKFIDK
jgi:phosphoglycolate phosphatase-like HAD superfamily hydrolase